MAHTFTKREKALFDKAYKVLRGGVELPPPHRGTPIFLDWSFKHQFNPTSRTLSETIGKWVLLMWERGHCEEH